MDREILIKMITQEVLRQMESGKDSGSAPDTAVSADKLLLSDMRSGAKVTDMKRLFDQAGRSGSYGVCIPQWFVSLAKENLYGSQTKIATIVGLPGGTNSPMAKYAEIKQAVAAGADMVLVPVNMDKCRAGDIKGVQKELAESLTASKGKAEAAAVIEVKDVDDRTMKEAAEACAAVGAKTVMLSAIAGGSVKADLVRDLKATGVSVGVIGGATDRQAEYKRAGADWLVVRNR